MKCFIIASAVALLMTPAFGQTSSSTGSQSPQANQSASNNSQPQNGAAAQKLKQSLENEGFTDVKVVAQSFVVQGKSPDGDPVVMTIGPHGMSVFEAMNAAGPGQTTGSSNHSSTGTSKPGSSSESPSTNSNSQTQR